MALRDFVKKITSPFTTPPSPTQTSTLAVLPYAIGQAVQRLGQKILPTAAAPVIRPEGVPTLEAPGPSYPVPISQYQAQTGQTISRLNVASGFGPEYAQRFVEAKGLGYALQPISRPSSPAPAPTSPAPTYYQPAVTPRPSTSAPAPTTLPNQAINASSPLYVPPPPKVAPSGQPGVSASILQPVAPSGQPGVSSGVAAHTGLLGGVAAGVALPSSAEQEEKKKTYTIKPGDTLSQIARQQGVSLNDILKANPQITNPNLIRTGAVINLPTSSAPSAAPSIKLPQAVSPQGVVDLEQISQGLTQVKDLLKSPLSRQTASEVNNYLENTKQVLYQAQAALNPALQMVEPMPLVPQEGLQKEGPDFVAKWEEIAREYGLPDQIKQIEDMRTKILAESQAYDTLMKDIQSDPDFPKRLAQRRLAAIEKAKNTNLQALQLQLNFLVDNYNQKLELAKYKAGLYEQEYTTQATERERAIDNNRQMIQQMISTGTLGSLTDAELAQWANATGYTLESLKAMRKAVKTGNDLKIAQAQTNLEKTAQSMDIAAQRLELAQQRLGLEQERLALAQQKSGARFTSSQLNRGAAIAGVPVSDFRTFDDVSKNFFINNASTFNRMKKTIDKALANNENPAAIEGEISSSQTLPPEAKNVLVRYLHDKAPAKQSGGGGFLGNLTKSIFDFFSR